MSNRKPADKQSAKASLRLIAAMAEKLAIDLEKGLLWDDGYTNGLARIQTELDAARNA